MIFVVALVAWLLLGLIWTLILLVPFYVYVALSIAWLVRRHRKQAQTTMLAREAERQRRLNDQEFNAWQSAAEDARRTPTKRDRALRQFDQRNPPRD